MTAARKSRFSLSTHRVTEIPSPSATFPPTAFLIPGRRRRRRVGWVAMITLGLWIDGYNRRLFEVVSKTLSRVARAMPEQCHQGKASREVPLHTGHSHTRTEDETAAVSCVATKTEAKKSLLLAPGLAPGSHLFE